MDEPRQCCDRPLNGLKKYLVAVAVAVTTALLGQSMALVWWAATITTRVEYVEKAVDGLSGRAHTIETARASRP
jgi:hypothetical protein